MFPKGKIHRRGLVGQDDHAAAVVLRVSAWLDGT
jgi:hypothetical protein